MDPVLTGAAANLSAEAAKGIFKEIKRHIRYVFIYKKNVEKFEQKLKTLIAKRTSVQQEVDAARRNVERIKEDVEFWCETADNKMEEEEKKVKELEDKAKNRCFIGLCPNIKSRYQLSRKAEEGVAAFDDLIRECKFSRSVGYRDVPGVIWGADSKEFEAFKSRQKVFNNVMEELNNDTIRMIGVYGGGGVGKTTLVNEIAGRVEQVKLFDRVVKATVTQNPDILKIQDEIAEWLGLTLQENTPSARASRLHERLMSREEKKILIVLDNVWKKLDLEKVGIPTEGVLNPSNKRCKILLTSRYQHVLSDEMDVKATFEVGLLEENEAWDLFKKRAGAVVDSPEVGPIAIEVAIKCGRLPVAIATVARALRNKPLFAWKDALTKLQTPSSANFEGISAEAYEAIKLSYTHLASDELKQTFLLCGVLGTNVSFEYLLRYCMGLGLFHGVNTVEKTRDRLLTIVSELKTSFLLNDSTSNRRVCMHDLISGVALAIASEGNHVFTLEPNDVPEDWPDAETMKILHMIILRRARINKFPDGDELDCPELTFLYVDSHESSGEMPTNFFQKMEYLKVLDLTSMHFSSLPSINFLKRLRTLCLDNCLSLGDISIVGEMGSLEILSLVNSNIEILPEKIGQLIKLKILDLSGCDKLKTIPPGVLSGLFRLEELYMGDSFVQWEAEEDANQRSNASLAEFRNLSCLITLHVEIPSPKLMPKDLFFKNLQRYKICVGEAWDGFGKSEHTNALKLKLDASIDSLVDGVRILLKKAEALYLVELKGEKFVLNTKFDDRGSFPHLKSLYIQNGLEVQYILDGSDAAGKIELLQLQSLKLENLPKLISFCPRRKRGSSTLPPQPQEELPLFDEQIVFPCLEDLQLISIKVERLWHNQIFCTEKLKSLIIKGCGNLKHLFSSSTARSLVHLENFEIIGCKSLSEIVSTEDIEEESNDKILFPQLHTLKLKDLQHLIRFCSESHRIEFPSLLNLEIEGCPKLKGFVDKSDTEETQCFSNQALFNEKVACPNLVLLVLSSMKIQRIWHDQLPRMSSYAEKLRVLTVEGCHNLRCIFPSSMVQSLTQFEEFGIQNCRNLEEVISTEERLAEEDTRKLIFPKLKGFLLTELPKVERFGHGSYFAFPLLSWVTIANCPTFETFISDSAVAKETCIRQETERNNSEINFPPFFNEKVAFPQLENLTIIHIGNRRKIWHDQFNVDSFCKLNALRVSKCDRLLNIFPLNMRERLQNLKILTIGFCDSLEDIFETRVTVSESNVEETAINFLFPQLTTLDLAQLPNLKSFYPGRHATEFPSLQEMRVLGCDKAEMFASESLNLGESSNRQPMFWVSENTFPVLEELRLLGVGSMTKGQLQAKVFRKLRVLEIGDFTDESAVLPHCFIQSLQNLEKLVVLHASFTQIFHLEHYTDAKIHASALTSLTELRTHIWKKEDHRGQAFCKLRTLELKVCSKLKTLVPSSVSFENLMTLNVSRCNGLINLIACSTAKSLVQLSTMSIIDCDKIEEIIAGEGDEVEGGVVFMQLKYLELSCLPSLAGFCTGYYSLKFPALEKVTVKGCPNMEIFSPGYLSTPMLRTVQFTISEDEAYWEDDLNATIQRLFKEKHLVLSDETSNKLIKLWTRNPEAIVDFKRLQILEVYNCSTLKYLFTLSVVLELEKLSKIKVKNCIAMEHVIANEDTDQEKFEEKITLPQLDYIEIENCENMTSFCQVSQVREFPSLKTINVAACPRMLAFLEDKTIETIDDGGDRELTDVLSTSLLNKVVCPNLFEMELYSLNVQRIWWGQLIQNLTALSVKSCHNLKYLFSSAIAKLFIHLRGLDIEDCRNVEEVIFIEEGLAEADNMNHIFPKLEVLLLKNLPKLRRFCHGSYFEFPLLRNLRMENCPIFKTFISDSLVTVEADISEKSGGNSSDIDFPPLFSEKVAFPQLEQLKIISMGNCRKIWKDQLFGDSFCKLNLLWVAFSDRLVNIFPFNMSERLQNLETLLIRGCYSLEEIFEPRVLNPNKFHVVTATESIEEEIIACECDEETDGIVFTKLKYLQLRCLPNLDSFCSGDHILEFPSLEKIIVSECPKMKIFCQGDLSTPQLQKVLLTEDGGDEEKERWEGDLKTTITRLFEEINLQNSEEG